MSEFEFVMVSLAIILGLGVSEVLAGWADQVKARKRRRLFSLQLVSSAFILYMNLQYLWLMWISRNINWSFPVFLAVAGPALMLSLAARVSRIDTSKQAPPLRDQYFESSPAIYSLLLFFPILVTLISLFSDLREIIPNPPNLVAVTAVRVIVGGVYVGMAISKSERVHWVGLVVLWITAIGFMARFGSTLATAAG